MSCGTRYAFGAIRLRDVKTCCAKRNISHSRSEYIAHERSECISHGASRISHGVSRISQKGYEMNDKTIKELAVELTVEISRICDDVKAKSVFTNQLLRSCSSIGANSHEAKYAQSTPDFISKMEIALKECYETEYWLEILYRVRSLSEEQYKSTLNKCGTIRRKLIASITTAKKTSRIDNQSY